MKVSEVLTEVQAEFIPRDRSTFANMARQFLRNAQGDVDLAKKMADGLAQQVKDAIDQEARGQVQPPRAERSRSYGYA